MEHVDMAADLLGGPYQHRMTARGVDALTHQGGLCVRLGRQRRPDQAAAPVIDNVAAAVPRQSLTERAAGCGRTNDPPHRPRAQRPVGGEGLNVTDGTPDRRGAAILPAFTAP